MVDTLIIMITIISVIITVIIFSSSSSFSNSCLIINVPSHSWCYNYFTHLRTPHISFTWWISIGVWETAIIVKFPEFFHSILVDLNKTVVSMISTRLYYFHTKPTNYNWYHRHISQLFKVLAKF